MAYVVHNITNRTVMISDLRAEIAPHKMLDLEKVATRSNIEGSPDLRSALSASLLRVLSNTNRPEKKTVERIVERESALDEQKLTAIIRQAMRDGTLNTSSQQTDKEDMKKIMDVLYNVTSKLNNINKTDEKIEESVISGEDLANLQFKAMQKITDDIESSKTYRSAKKIKIDNKSVMDLADEL